MRESWTDERLDDFRDEVNRRFDAVDQRFDTMERRMDNGFNRVDADLRAMREEFTATQRELGERFDALYRVMIGFCGLVLAALISLVAMQ